MKSIHTILYSCAAVVASLALAGCQSTVFEHPPVAERACDAALVGEWRYVRPVDEKGEVKLVIGKTCRLLMLNHLGGATDRDEPTQLHLGMDEQQGYLWVDAGWASRQASSDEPTIPGDVFVLRYSLHDDKLDLQMPNNQAIAHRIIDVDLPGETHKSKKGLFNRITGTVTPQQLRLHDLFNEEHGIFERSDSRTGSKRMPAKRP